MNATIKVQTVEGDKNVKATVRGVFAAHKTVGAKNYTVSHVPSGLCLMQGLFTQHHAVVVAEMFAKIAGFADLIAALVLQPNDRATMSRIQSHTRGLRDQAWLIASTKG